MSEVSSTLFQEQGEYSLSSGELSIQVIAANAHHTTFSIRLNGRLIKNGSGDVNVISLVTAGEELYIKANIHKPSGGSIHAGLTVKLKDAGEEKVLEYTHPAADYEIVEYKVKIALV